MTEVKTKVEEKPAAKTAAKPTKAVKPKKESTQVLVREIVFVVGGKEQRETYKEDVPFSIPHQKFRELRTKAKAV